MSRARSLLAPIRLALADRLDRLRAALEHLTERLRERIANAVGREVAGAARAAVRALLDGRLPPPPTLPPRSHALLWGEGSWAQEGPPVPPSEDEGAAFAPEPPAPPAPPPSGCWGRALLAGAQAAAWWLKGRSGRPPLPAALAVGAAAGALAFVAGPLAGAGVALAGSALSLLTFAEAAGVGAEALAGP